MRSARVAEDVERVAHDFQGIAAAPCEPRERRKRMRATLDRAMTPDVRELDERGMDHELATRLGLPEE